MIKELDIQASKPSSSICLCVYIFKCTHSLVDNTNHGRPTVAVLLQRPQFQYNLRESKTLINEAIYPPDKRFSHSHDLQRLVG